MECPKCGKKAKVIDSRPYIGGVYRRRKCTSCDYQFYTEEFLTEDISAVRSCLAYQRAKSRAKKKGEDFIDET